MLYPKNKTPLDKALFENPTAEYRGAPFWAWNGRLEKKELCRQIETFKKMGFGGFYMHVRTGLQTPYMGAEFLDMVDTCIQKAQAEDMLAYLYDEDRWPSGQAGGLVTKNEAFRCRRLVLTRIPQQEHSRLTYLASYQVELDDDGYLVAYAPIKKGQAPAKGFVYYAYKMIDGPNGYFNGQCEVDRLNPAATAEFLRVTHENYAARFGDKFGKSIPAIFTDEPAAAWKRLLPNPDAGAYEMRFPWTDDLPESFAAAYGGADIFAGLPELVWDLPGGQPSLFRYRFHDHTTWRFYTGYIQPCGDWCRAHGLHFTGHLAEEDSFYGQTSAIGDAMRMYPAFGLPGIDVLDDERIFTTCKQTQSTVRQQGKEGMTSELYGATNWDFDFRAMKQQGDWQAALGVTVRTPHLAWYSMQGEAKRDYPPTFNDPAPWVEDYKLIEDHFARLNTVLTRGQSVTRIGVIHPIESYWMHWGPKTHTQAARDTMQERFDTLSHWLLKNTLDFDYICEATLPADCPAEDIGAQFPVGQCAYDVVIVPGCEMLRSTTIERLEAFAAKGGKVLFMGGAPRWCDGAVSPRGKALYDQCAKIDFDQAQLLQALEPYRQLRVVYLNTPLGRISSNPGDILYQLRQEGEHRWLFIAQANKNPNFTLPRRLQFTLQGLWEPTVYDSMTGCTHPAEYTHRGGQTIIEQTMYNHDSLLLQLQPVSVANTQPLTAWTAPQYTEKQQYVSAVPVTLQEPNVLLLDMAEYALDDADWQPAEEILRIGEQLRIGLGGEPMAGGMATQPWVLPKAPEAHTLRLRYRFNSQIEVKNVALGIENAATTQIRFNGKPAGRVKGWYIHPSISTVELPPVQVGENILELQMSFGPQTEPEACYLLGDFGVQVAGCQCTVTPPVRYLHFGDITRQGLPFYGGNVTYHLWVAPAQEALHLNVTQYEGALVKATVNGKALQPMCFAPYRVALPAGATQVDVTIVGTRVNTFGQLHCVKKQDIWWGPATWRTTDENWSYQYQFWPQGILKSPILSCKKEA